MQRAIIVRGTLADPQHIELDEPVTELHGPVEVVLRTAAPQQAFCDVFELIASLSPGSRSKEDIDCQIAEERSSWGDR